MYHKIIEQITYEMSHTQLNSKKESVVGFQYRNKLTKQAIIDFLFNTIIVLNSSLGRLYIIENYNQLMFHQYFIKTRTSDHKFGFSLSNNDEINRKYNYSPRQLSRPCETDSRPFDSHRDHATPISKMQHHH